MLERPLTEKVALGSDTLLDWQLKINRDYGKEIRPTRPSLGNPLVGEVHRMLEGLPPLVKRLAQRHMVALYLVENDFGTGTTEAVQDAAGRWRYAYVALNLTELSRPANQWGSWKEESSFRPRSGHAIRMVLENPEADTREAAIRFIFLHELGHVVGLALGVHGWWDAEPLPLTTRDSPFVTISWQEGKKGKMISRWRESQPVLSKLAFYNFDKAKLDGSQAEVAYRSLAKTDFPSLYGATNLFDDFAEAFALYIHIRLMHRPYRVETIRDGKVQFTFRSCIEMGGCESKVREMENLLRGR